MLDRLAALHAERNPYIRSQNWNVPLLKLDDFQIEQSQSQQQVWPTQQLAQLFVDKVRLCVHYHDGGPAAPTVSISKSIDTGNFQEGEFLEEDDETKLIYYVYNQRTSDVSTPPQSSYGHQNISSEEATLLEYIYERGRGDVGWEGGWDCGWDL